MKYKFCADVYRLHVWIRQISPMIWHCLLARSSSTIADLRYMLQIAFGWSDTHLNLSHIHGRNYGVCHDGRINFPTDPTQVRLSVEACLDLEEKRIYPCCIGGKRRAPPEEPSRLYSAP